MIARLISVKVNGRTHKYRVTLEPDEDGRIVADCPAIKGCYTGGRTLEEAIEMMKDALRVSIESLIEVGDIIPEVEYQRTRPKKMIFGRHENSFRYIPV